MNLETLTDQQLVHQYAKCDLWLREHITTAGTSSATAGIEKLMNEVLVEQKRRRMAKGAAY